MEILKPAQPDIVTPTISIECHLGKVALTWFNTRIRVFSEPHEVFNHAEFYWPVEENQQLHAIQYEPLLDLLFENDYPLLSMPYVDAKTEDWLTELEITDLGGVLPRDFTL